MRPVPAVVVDEALWEATLLSADSELLLGAARNYLGPVKTPYDKREIVARLRAFLSRAETRRAILELLDGLDARILASLFLLGPLPEAELRSLFEGELLSLWGFIVHFAAIAAMMRLISAMSSGLTCDRSISSPSGSLESRWYTLPP